MAFVFEDRLTADQKIEELLRFALGLSRKERKESLELSVGYEEEAKEWELILKYEGEIAPVRSVVTKVKELLGGYAVVKVKEEKIQALSSIPNVIYIEKPKALFFQMENGKRVSCIPKRQEAPFALTGKGVLVGIIDSGLDTEHEQFLDEKGESRVVAFWDQIGKQLEDHSGHGTQVAAIAAGKEGVASEAQIIAVKLAYPDANGFPRTTQLMEGVDYMVRTAMERMQPVAINISFGNSYGSHKGNSLLEQYLNTVANMGKTVICVGSGNEGDTGGHASGVLASYETKEVEVAVTSRQHGLSIQLWKSYSDEMEITILTPKGKEAGPFRMEKELAKVQMDGAGIFVYYGEPAPFSTDQEVYIELIPETDYLPEGIWKVKLTAKKVKEGRFHLWLPAQAVRNEGTAFLRPDAANTLTIPSTADRVITVGAYNGLTFSYAPFSGRGGENKPDLSAPGVLIRTASPGGGYVEVSGTSFAVPFVTGSAALLMEWGIIRGNDPYLYGEKVKAYLRKGAKELPGERSWPNEKLGYGALCMTDSLQ